MNEVFENGLKRKLIFSKHHQLVGELLCKEA